MRTRAPNVSRMYLLRTKSKASPTWYGVHIIGPITKLTHTHLLAFSERAHAHSYARALELHRAKHGAYPNREFFKWPKAHEWMEADGTVEVSDIEVVETTMADVLAMMKGTGVSCRLLVDPADMRRKIDVKQPFDKAATCARLEQAFMKLDVNDAN